MADVARMPLRAALTLAVVGAIGLGGLLGVRALTAKRIAAQEREAAIAAVAALLPPGFDNDPNLDQVRVQAPAWLGSEEGLIVRRARRDGALQALLVEAVAPDGYNGDIRLLVGIALPGADADALQTREAAPSIIGVRVIDHRETPGLGDYIDAARDPWSGQFRERSLGDPPLDAWRVQRDGGAFDAVAGATISARAVVGAVRRALQFAEAHGAELGRADVGATLGFRDAPPVRDGRPAREVTVGALVDNDKTAP